MTSQLEFESRAALCRQLAKQEPTNRALWMAEAESWARLSNRKLPGERSARIGSIALVSRSARLTSRLSIPTSAGFA
jgi:hypothetical protein